MVKRITASLLLVLVGTISILAQIDYNKQIKNAPAVSQGNMNGVRVVDGLKFAQSAAGINAADADLGTAFGEIWIPSTALAGMTATDAQISISKNHTLRLMGRLNIDSVNKGPILLATGAKIICNETDTSPIINVGVGTSPSLIRLAVQDGSVTDGLFVEGCLISAGIQPVTNGVIDASGSANLAKIRDNYIFGFTSGWGIFVQDIQSGALAGTDNLEIQGNNITASNTGGCIEITHSATNNVVLNNISIIDNTCIPGASLAVGAPIAVQNLTTTTKVEQINILNLNIFAIPASQEGVYINGVYQATVKHVFCGSGTSCVYIANNTNNLAISADNIACSGCTNVFQDIANNYINNNNYINHYGFNASSQNFSGNNVLQGVTSTGNFNQIRIVDGVRFANSAAGINAADADLGAALGEVWIPAGGHTATDAQISIRTNHTLRIFGQITIDALNQGPVLLQGAARIVCEGNFGAVNILNTSAQTNITSMVRLSVQDGSLGGMEIDGCRFDANGSTVTNGVIDVSGAVNGPSWIKDNLIAGFASGWGIFIQDIQSGALGGTNNVQITNNRTVGTGTGGCIEITHSSTNAVALRGFDIVDLNCLAGASITTAPVLLQNTSANAFSTSQINIMNANLSPPSGQPGITINGVSQATLRHIYCTAGNNCVNIPSSANNTAILLDSIFTYSGNNTLFDSANGVTVNTASLLHYDYPNSLSTSDYFNAVSYLKVNGLSPSVTGTGFGTGPTFGVNAGSTNNAGLIQITTGTTPSSSGTFSLNFNTTQSVFGVNPPSCVWTLGDSSGSWAQTATVHVNNTTTSQNQISWFNGGTNLTASVNYNLQYWCAAK